MPTLRFLRPAIRALAAVLLFAAAAPVPAGAQTLQRYIDRFVDGLNEEPVRELGPPQARPTPRTWNALDSLVLAALGNGIAPHRLDSLLATLPGYRPTTPGEGFQLGRTTFYSSLPSDAPNYLAAPVRVGGETLLLGLYSLTYNGTGRLSVYGRRGGRWRQTARVDAGGPLTAHLLPLGDITLGMVTVERFVGADRQEGRIKLWRLGPGGGLRLQRAETGRHVDWEAARTDSTITVAYDSFPKHVMGAVLGPRLEYRTTYRARGGRIAADTVSLTPWLEVVDRFYGRIDRGQRTRARELTASEPVFRALTAYDGAAREEGGDLARGEGWVLLHSYGRTHSLRVEACRGPGGAWRIVRATEVEPTGD